MKRLLSLMGVGVLAVMTTAALAQGTAPGHGLDPATLTATLSKPATDSWPTYAGDYSGRRFSPLTQIDRDNVHGLTLAWIGHVTAGPGGAAGGRRGGGGGYPTWVGGIATDPASIQGSSSGEPKISASILQVDGILYFSSPDNAWAMDARDGTVLWHYWWKSRGGTHIGNRGMAMYRDWLYFETPDDVLVSLDAKTGKERWHKEISDFNQQYFSTTAPVVVGDHVLVGTSVDIDEPGFLQSFDPTTGALQWKHYTVPMAKGDAGLDTWSSLDAAQHGGATVWMPGSYDPETHLYVFGTGNAIPAYSAVPRSNGPKETNLFTCSIIAVNVDTGKMAWYYQTARSDTHDWDSANQPVFVDGVFDGKPRKLVIGAGRNGYFYVLDRVTGKSLLTRQFDSAANWAAEIDAEGSVVRNPEKDATIAGSLTADDTGGVNWPPASYDPQTGLFYVGVHRGYSLYYLNLKDTRLIMGLGGAETDNVGSTGTSLEGIDYKTGKVAWNYRFLSGGPGGLLTTAGGLLFSGDGNGDLIAFDAAKPTPLWHARIGVVSNAPETYMLDGSQFVLAAAGGTIYAFKLQPPPAGAAMAAR